MENFIIINTENFSFVVKVNGNVKYNDIVKAFARYNGKDDTDEEMVDHVFKKLKVKYEILPAMIVNI